MNTNCKGAIENAIDVVNRELSTMNETQCDAVDIILKRLLHSSDLDRCYDNKAGNSRVRIAAVLSSFSAYSDRHVGIVALLNNIVCSCAAVKAYRELLGEDTVTDMVVL